MEKYIQCVRAIFAISSPLVSLFLASAARSLYSSSPHIFFTISATAIVTAIYISHILFDFNVKLVVSTSLWAPFRRAKININNNRIFIVQHIHSYAYACIRACTYFSPFSTPLLFYVTILRSCFCEAAYQFALAIRRIYVCFLSRDDYAMSICVVSATN